MPDPTPATPEEHPVHPPEPAPAAPAAPAATAPATAEPPPDTLAAHYAQHLAAAQNLAADEVLHFTAEPALMTANVRRGAAAVVALQPALQADLPNADWSAPGRAESLAYAVWHAWKQAAIASNGTGDLAEQVQRIHPVRRLLFAAAEVLVAASLLPSAEVDALRKGRGAVDAATDVDALATLLLVNWTTVQGKVPLDVAAVTQAQADAKALLLRLRPAQRLGDTGKRGEAAVTADVRDRLFTLLVRTYDEVRRVAAYKWLDDASSHVPRLNQRRV